MEEKEREKRELQEGRSSSPGKIKPEEDDKSIKSADCEEQGKEFAKMT